MRFLVLLFALASAPAFAQDFSLLGLFDSGASPAGGGSCALGAYASAAEDRTVEVDPTLVPVGYIMISRADKVLYYGLGQGRALRFRVAIPADSPAKKWLGHNVIKQKYQCPAWAAPKLVLLTHPEFTGRVIPGGDAGNPMGAAALEMTDHESAIHGTTQKMRASIGTAASYGCVRMLNEDVSLLYNYAREGGIVCMGNSLSDARARCRAEGY